jgi:hypothetical protein
LLIEIIALSRYKKNPTTPISEYQQKVWVEMQKAYLTNNLFRFRNVQYATPLDLFGTLASLKMEDVEDID